MRQFFRRILLPKFPVSFSAWDVGIGFSFGKSIHDKLADPLAALMNGAYRRVFGNTLCAEESIQIVERSDAKNSEVRVGPCHPQSITGFSQGGEHHWLDTRTAGRYDGGLPIMRCPSIVNEEPQGGLTSKLRAEVAAGEAPHP